MSRLALRSVSLTLLLLLVTSWSAMAGEPHHRHAELSRLVVVGDSLSAGYQNSSLLAGQQVHGYASVVAAQAGVSLPLPLIAAPGLPNVLTLVDPGPPPVIAPAPGASPGRVDPFTQAMDLAVPGAFVQDALTTRPNLAFDDLTDVVLGLPGLLGGVSRSQIEWAEALAPTTVFVWLGNMDALAAALFGTPSALTSVLEFRRAYTEVMDRLAATGATLVVANIPDVTVIPFLVPAETVAGFTGAPLEVVGPALGIGPGDFVILDTFMVLDEHGLNPIERILLGLAAGPLPDALVVSAAEVTRIRAAIAAFNGIIAEQAKARRAALVDVHALFERVRAHGVTVHGRRLNTSYLGGLFSLDGIHPTNTGYAVLANAFIRALNRGFDADIPRVSLAKIAADDPLVLSAAGHSGRPHDDQEEETD